jgi:hypothetical protein
VRSATLSVRDRDFERFYEKVIKVKDDVAALLNFIFGFISAIVTAKVQPALASLTSLGT